MAAARRKIQRRKQIFLALATVWLALRKPIKTVSALSPIEAIIYQESKGKNKGIRKGRKTIKVFDVTLAGLSGSLKNNISTICTMGLSCVLFAGTVLIALILGTPAGYLLFSYGKENSWFGLNEYHFPVVEMGLMIAAIALLQITLSYLLSRNLKKASLVERIRYHG